MTKTALIVIDVQEAFNQRVALGHKRNNHLAEQHIAKLLLAFRQAGEMVYHVHHASTDANSLFRPDRPGFKVQGFAKPLPYEPVLVKDVNSAFIGTTLESDLRTAGITDLVIVGATTNHCVETSTRMAGNLGFDVQLVRDACWAFDQLGIDGDPLRAQDIHLMSLANLNREFARIVWSRDVLARIDEG